MSLKDDIRLSAEDAQKIVVGDLAKGCLVTREYDESSDMPLFKISLNDFEATYCKSFEAMMKEIVESLPVHKTVDGTYFDVISEIHYAQLQVAVKGRRGKARNIVVNQKTYNALDEEIRVWLKEQNLIVDICKSIPNDTILLGYFTSLFDRAIHAKKKNVMGWQYFYCKDMLKENCRIFKVQG